MTEGGRIDDVGNLATVTVVRNDDPVSILADDLYVRGVEGEVVTFNITRGGQANGEERE